MSPPPISSVNCSITAGWRGCRCLGVLARALSGAAASPPEQLGGGAFRVGLRDPVSCELLGGSDLIRGHSS